PPLSILAQIASRSLLSNAMMMGTCMFSFGTVLWCAWEKELFPKMAKEKSPGMFRFALFALLKAIPNFSMLIKLMSFVLQARAPFVMRRTVQNLSEKFAPVRALLLRFFPLRKRLALLSRGFQVNLGCRRNPSSLSISVGEAVRFLMFQKGVLRNS